MSHDHDYENRLFYLRQVHYIRVPSHGAEPRLDAISTAVPACVIGLTAGHGHQSAISRWLKIKGVMSRLVADRVEDRCADLLVWGAATKQCAKFHPADTVQAGMQGSRRRQPYPVATVTEVLG
jgi:hypothetical protein